MAGFGDIRGNFWAGLDKIHAMTAAYDTELYVYMETFENESAYAQYSSFSVDDASPGYRSTVSGYSGTAGDAMYYNNNMRFTTYDRDQDAKQEVHSYYSGNGRYKYYIMNVNCAASHKGGWWFNKCTYCNPNGQYLEGHSSSESIFWYQWNGHHSLKTIELKVRRL